MPRLSAPVVVCILAALWGAACSGTEQIQTAPPQAWTPAPEGDEAAAEAPLTVVLDRGETALPEAVETLRFRVAEVWLKPEDSPWIRYPAQANRFEMSADRGAPPRTILATRLPPATYDSLGLVLDDVYVQYDANAGGPLTMPRGNPLKLDVDLRPQVGRATTLHLALEPGASLTHTDACRWYFLPFITSPESGVPSP